jgi:hypothetical protein
MNQSGTRSMRSRLALFSVLTVFWMLLGIAGPVEAQTNSPSGGQSTGEAPAQSGPNSGAGSNVGGDGQAGNRTNPGGAGATGGGSSGTGDSDTADGGKAGMIAGVVGIAAVIGVGLAIATRHRRVMEDANV